MPDVVDYNEFELRAWTHQLQQSGRWTIGVHIRRNNAVQPFSARDTVATRDEAVAASLQFGRDIVDGKVPACSVTDLL